MSEKLQGESYKTLRPTVPALEEMLQKTLPVLDHGFVRLIDYMGDDAAVVQAARVSYGRGTKRANEDKGLINYLMRHSHTTPFEMCEIKLHIKLPIFIARQWIRHRTASVNEYSARYSVLDREFYIPKREHLAKQSSLNKQGRDALLSDHEANEVLELLKHDASMLYRNYMRMLNMDDATGEVIDQGRDGLTRELARMNLSLNYYTQWYWKIDLHNLLHFLKLRADPHAQFEIREYAGVILELVKKWVPYTYEAFSNYKLGVAHISEAALNVIRAMINGKIVAQEESGISKREWSDLMALLGK
ncbi:FAD-dependent thymidylate synthase [Candidatus Lariskella endosymbiont of Hedychridium roseum]|uniref:FAD-dependent thymidylate synthase n=1 Tax=Candidatus Lariskella endosymbiont of Hedychridium roseum TaxID=3077949 RepID=UPI0030CB9CEC